MKNGMIHSVGRVLRWMALAAVPAFIAAVLLRGVFVVRRIEVFGGTGMISGATVAQMSGIEQGMSIFRVDADAVAQAVNTCGILRVESVELEYPDGVCIRLQPRRPVAMLSFGGVMCLLDGEGCMVESRPEAPDRDLIYLSGMRVRGCSPGREVEADETQLAAYRAVMEACEASGANIYISELDLTDVQNIRIITRGGVAVRLGNTDCIQDKIAWMKAVVADLEHRGETGGTLDVRSSSRADYRPPGADHTENRTQL